MDSCKSASLFASGFRGVFRALYANGLPRALPGPGIGRGALTAHWKPATVANAAIAVDGLKPLQVRLNLTTQIAFDGQFARGDRLNDVVQLLRRQILRAHVGLNVGLFEDLLRSARADPVDVWQRSVDALVAGDFNS